MLARMRLPRLTAVCALVVTACGSQARAVYTRNVRPDRCRSAQLVATVGRMGAAAGSEGTSIILRNQWRSACWLAGYPSIQLIGLAGRTVPTSVTHRPAMVMPPDLRVHKVMLAHGQSVRVYVGYSNPGDFIGMRGFAGCPASTRVKLVPPGDQASIAVKVSIGGADEIKGHIRCGELSISPVTRAVAGWA